MRISDWSSDVCSSDLESSEIGKALSEAIETRKPRTVRFRFASKHNSFWATARVKPWKRGAAIVIRDLSQDERDEITREQWGSRSEERSVGKECVSTCRSRWSENHRNHKNTQISVTHKD